ncbi:hypothetical protein CKO28_00955 [Rhodovibrio sodomensis]|uniref:T4 RNA ligase 1-like N-terminal domain-containing protein n=1 Tax=Rhodovibrio sodomensis TaxID=1088 RepID=A0ABS1D9F7_9PROT|nr:RNA ligase [Rhodovibrio sodomensis]MBK1666611.1 hypothetical protein [Rhodovibrio sodomensis]
MTVIEKLSFPEMAHIDDIQPALFGAEDVEAAFRVNHREGYLSVDYNIMLPGIWGCMVRDTDPEQVRLNLLRRELRGLKFCADSGDLIARPFQKFFNLMERPETLPEALDFSKPHAVLLKLDGSMVHPANVRGELVMMTRKGHVNAADAQAFAFSHPTIPYARFCRTMLASGWTPVFEWCTRKTPIVIDYPVDQLILTAVRENRTGQYLTYPEMERLGHDWDIPVVPLFASDIGCIHSFIERTRHMTGIEGAVIRFDDGTSLKLKTDDYRARHGLVEDFGREDRVIETILAGTADDMLATLTPPEQAALREQTQAVFSGLQARADAIAWVIERGRELYGDDRKQMAGHIARAYAGASKELKSAAMNTMSNSDIVANLKRVLIEPQNGRLKDVERAKHLLQIDDWSDVRNRHLVASSSGIRKEI